MAPHRTSFKKILSTLSLPIDNPGFLSSVRGAYTKDASRTSLLMQEPTYRLRDRALKYARMLLESEFGSLSEVIEGLKKELYAVGETQNIESYHKTYLLDRLETIQDQPRLQSQILGLKRPLINQKIEQLIRKGVRLRVADKITDLEVQLLCLSAYLTPLRQSVGSCFATAPAIYVQREQPTLFFQDLEDLLNIGLLKRTFSGQELSLPLSPSWGRGTLDFPFIYRSNQNPWASEEVFQIFEELNFFKKDWKDEKKEQTAESIFKKLGFVENELLTLDTVLKRLLLYQHKLDPNEVERHKSQVQPMGGLRSISPSSSKVDHFLEDLNSTRLHLIQIADHPLLKSWEYTIASFAESKSEFYKWNLYTSLGFDSKEEGGIAKAIYEYLEETLEKNQREIEHLDKEYEQEFFRVKYLQKRVEDTESEHMASWARVEYQNHLNDLNRHLHARDDLIEKTNRLSKLLPKLIESFDELFPRYFQELYDAQMQDYSKGILEDSPAGFRLIYKHGRSDPALWTFITSEEEFIDALKDFFVLTENEVLSKEMFEDFEKEVLEINTLIVKLVQTEEFIQRGYERICKRYQIPYPKDGSVDKLPFKPWAYISGGTLTRLLSNYYKREQPFYEEQKKIANETELLAFFIETVRLFPKEEMESYIENPDKSLIMYSPSHAFLFKPGWMPVKDVWDKEVYPFSWIRDEITTRHSKFIDSIEVAPHHVISFLEHYTGDNPYLCLWLKENILWPNYSISIPTFHDLLCSHLNHIPASVGWQKLSEESIESWIYEFFPVVDKPDLYRASAQVIQQLKLTDERGALEVLTTLLDRPMQPQCLSAKQLHGLLESLFILLSGQSENKIDYSQRILEEMRKCGRAMPRPLFFADTNWPYYAFAHLVNPSTSKLELWRVDRLGQTGFPMHAWKKWFSEENPSTWSILTKPNEYQPQDRRALYHPI